MSSPAGSCTHSNNGSSGDDNARSVRHLSFAIAGYARVVADVLVPDVADAQLGAVVEDSHSARRLHRIRVLVPQDLRRGRTLRLAVEDDSVSWKRLYVLVISSVFLIILHNIIMTY